MPTFNTLIGLPFLFTIPAFFVWAALSFHVWSSQGRDLSIKNYRLSVSTFLAATALLVMDLARLRFHVRLWSVDPDATTILVFAIRWFWGLSVLWSTAVLYGHKLPLWGRKPEEEPFLVSEEPDAPDPDEERTNLLFVSIRQVAASLNEIVARIESAEQVAFADKRRREKQR